MHESHYIAEGWRHLEGASPANAGIDELDEQQDDHVKPIGYGGLHNDRQPYHDGHGHHQLQTTALVTEHDMFTHQGRPCVALSIALAATPRNVSGYRQLKWAT